MRKTLVLPALLEAEVEPTFKSYNEAVDSTIKDPQQISSLAEGNVRDNVLILLTTHSHRLAIFLSRLRTVLRQIPKSQAISDVAAVTADLFVWMLPEIQQLLEPGKVLDLLLPALDVCFTSPNRPTLWELGSVLANCGTLLEHLVSDRLGIEIIRQWASVQSANALKAGTLEIWTERLVDMVNNCTIDHGVADEIKLWHMLKLLKTSLQSIEHITAESTGKQFTPATRNDLPALGNMTRLRKEDKKARPTRRQDANSNIPSLEDDDKRFLKVFDIHVPGSRSSLLQAIKRLEGEKTTAIFLAIASKSPCYLCISGLGSLSRNSKDRIDDESFQVTSLPQVEILDKGVGVWKVLLSPQALRSVLHMGSHGQIRCS